MAPSTPPPSANASTPSSDAAPLSRARWLLASVLATLSLGGIVLSWSNRPPPISAAAVRTDQHASTVLMPSVSESDSIVRLIDLNSAGPQAMEMLPGIGPVLARRIVEDRTLHGEFASLDDLDRVRGIGPRTIDKFRSIAQVIPSPGAP